MSTPEDRGPGDEERRVGSLAEEAAKLLEVLRNAGGSNAAEWLGSVGSAFGSSGRSSAGWGSSPWSGSPWGGSGRREPGDSDSRSGRSGRGDDPWAEAVDDLSAGARPADATAHRGEECEVCPVCRLMRATRGTNPRAYAHLLAAATSLAAAGREIVRDLDLRARERDEREHRHEDDGPQTRPEGEEQGWA